MIKKAMVALLLCGVLAAAQGRTLVQTGTLIDGLSSSPRHEVTVVVEGNRIVDVAVGYLSGAAGDRVINLKTATLMPGWIDSHVHLVGEQNKDTYTEGFFLNSVDLAFRSTMYAKRTLLAGFTAVRDLGDSDYEIVALRKAIAAGYVDGPRIFAAGPALGTTGSHADPTNGYNSELQNLLPATSVFNGPDEARKAVRVHYKRGVDVIKVMATGGVLSLGDGGKNPEISEEEIKAVVETAHDCGLKVAVHAHGDEGIQRAVRAGVDSIEHGSFMSETSRQLMRDRGTYYVPTLSAGHFCVEKAKQPGFFPDEVRKKAEEVGPVMTATFQKALQAGLKIAFGTDTGVTPHGENANEFIYIGRGRHVRDERDKSRNDRSRQIDWRR